MPERDLSLSMAVWSHEHLTNATLLLLLRIRSIALLSRQRLDSSCYCRSLGNELCRLWMNSFWTREPAMHEDCLSSTDTDKKKDVVIVVVHHRRHHQCCRPRRRRCDRSSLGDCLSKLKLPDWTQTEDKCGRGGSRYTGKIGLCPGLGNVKRSKFSSFSVSSFVCRCVSAVTICRSAPATSFFLFT